MFTAITTEFIEKFSALNNMIADVYIKHLLYGTQKIKRCVLHPIFDEGRIGVTINNEDIYITTEELMGIWVGANQYTIKSELMELRIDLL